MGYVKESAYSAYNFSFFIGCVVSVFFNNCYSTYA